MDMFRLILPQLIELIIFLFVLWLVVSFIKRNLSEENKDVKVYKIAWVITFIVVIGFAIWIFQIASVNSIPRSVIDRSAPQNMQDSFESKMKRDAAQQKQKTDSISPKPKNQN